MLQRLLLTAKTLSLGLLAWIAVLTFLPLSSCGNPGCVFAATCESPTATQNQAVGQNPATPPTNGQRILSGAPEVEASFPSGATNHSGTPAVVVFTESMSDSVLNSFQMVRTDVPEAVATNQTLVGDGHVLVLLPMSDLVAGASYEVQAVQNPSDLTGQPMELVDDSDDTITPTPVAVQNFAIANTDPVNPSVVTFYPLPGSNQSSDIAEIVAVFDTELAFETEFLPPPASTITVEDAWNVQVTPVGGMATAIDGPDPAVGMFTFLFTEVANPRLFTWRNVDAAGEPISLVSAGGAVSLGLAGVSGLNGGILPTSTLNFTVSALGPPDPVLLSDSTTLERRMEIGTDNILNNELQVQLSLPAAAAGDVLGVYLFGTALPTEGDGGATAEQIALPAREITLSGTGPINQANFGLADLNLDTGEDPFQAVFDDGPVAMGFYMRRGDSVGHLRILDVDLESSGIQDPLLDTTPPQVLGLTGQLDPSLPFASDMSDLVVSGLATEQLSAVKVNATDAFMTVLSNGGDKPAVVASNSTSFIAAPVAVGYLEPATIAPQVLEITAFDLAGNASTVFDSVFVQRGVVGLEPIDFSGSGEIQVEVFDAQTLLPVLDSDSDPVVVYSHSDVGDNTFPLRDQISLSTTIGVATGIGSINHHLMGETGMLLTVVHPDYDVFTFHGVPARSISIPLQPTQSAADDSMVAGDVRPDSLSSNTVQLFLDAQTLWFGDTRRSGSDAGVVLLSPTDCSLVNNLSACGFGPEIIRPGRLGAFSVLGGDFSAAAGLNLFELVAPALPAIPGATDTRTVEVLRLFEETGVSAELLPVMLGAGGLQLDSSGLSVVDTGNLVGDSGTLGDARVVVEAVLPGVDSGLPVGLGITTGTSSPFPISAAYGGLVEEMSSGDPRAGVQELYLSVELRDASGNVAGVRPKVSDVTGAVTVAPLDVATFAAGMPAATETSAEVAFEVDDLFGGSLDGRGLYRVQMIERDGGGAAVRRWQIYRPDTIGSTQVRLQVPALGLDGMGDPIVPFASGADVDISVSAWGWNDLFQPNPSGTIAFAFTDLERLAEVFSHSPEDAGSFTWNY